MKYLGIDLGLDGGVTLVTQTGSAFVFRIPTYKKVVNKKNRRQYDLPALWDSLERLGIQNCVAAVELGGVRPGQTAQGSKQTGYGEGMFHAFLTAAGIPFGKPVAPQTWKREFDLLGKEKSDSIAEAVRIFPSLVDEIGKKDGLAEALLIAEWRRRQG